MTLKKWVHDPLILGNDPFLFKGHGDSRYLFEGTSKRKTTDSGAPFFLLALRGDFSKNCTLFVNRPEQGSPLWRNTQVLDV